MPGLTPPRANETDQLLGYLGHQRYVVTLAAYGLSDEEARATPSASSLSVGGLIKHLAAVERFWAGVVSSGGPDGRAHGTDGASGAAGGAEDHEDHEDHEDQDYQAGFALRPDETLADALAGYASAAAETDRVARSFPPDHAVPVPRDAPWFPKDVQSWSVRWVLLHLIEETARHAGHADIVRESLDGATAFPLMAAAESWPASPWVKPWQRRPAVTGVA